MKSTKILSIFWHGVEAHPVGVDGTNPTVPVFREQIRFLKENYTPISTAEFLRVHANKCLVDSYDKPPVLLGFDDGFKNVIRYGLPILKEFKVPAVFFVIGEILRNPNFVPWYVERKYLLRKTTKKTIIYGNRNINLSLAEDRSKLRRTFDASFRTCAAEADRQKLLRDFAYALGVDRPKGPDLDEDLEFVQAKDLAKLGPSSLLTVGSHAMTHLDLATLNYEDQVYELEQSDLLLRQHCPSYYPVVAYPSGSFNTDTINVAKRIYKCGFATFLGSYRNLYAYRRIILGQDSVQEVAYAVSPLRLNCILPIKRLLALPVFRD